MRFERSHRSANAAPDRSRRYFAARLCYVAPAAIGLLLQPGEARSVEITVSWVEVQHEVRPRQGTWNVNKSLRLNLRGGNAITENYVARNSSGKTSELAGQGKFGDSMDLRGNTQSTWSVRDANTLVRTWSRSQHTETMEV